MPYTGWEPDKRAETIFWEVKDADEERESAVDQVCDLLASAEEAGLRGHPGYAAFLMCRAERAALRTGLLFLVSLVWSHAPAERSA